jgi:hypothetical protein
MAQLYEQAHRPDADDARMKAPIRLALIWHFHQPDYTDPATGRPAMPWTRLHALKDYADMAAFLERHPTVRATFNVVPTLLDSELQRSAQRSAPRIRSWRWRSRTRGRADPRSARSSSVILLL